jgi:hypothetical protein
VRPGYVLHFPATPYGEALALQRALASAVAQEA